MYTPLTRSCPAGYVLDGVKLQMDWKSYVALSVEKWLR